MHDQPIGSIHDYQVFRLTRELADEYKYQITDLWNLIPLSQHGVDDILQEESKGSIYFHKWDHSLLVLTKDSATVVAFIVGYERPGIAGTPYERDSIHLKSISVSQEFQKQGIGKLLLKLWLKFNREQGYKKLTGSLLFSVQTNSAEWNQRVNDFYQAAGFTFVGSKEYPNKIDNVYYLDPSE